MPDEVVNKCLECFKTAANKDLLHLILRLVVITTKEGLHCLGPGEKLGSRIFCYFICEFLHFKHNSHSHDLVLYTQGSTGHHGEGVAAPILTGIDRGDFILADNLQHSDNIPTTFLLLAKKTVKIFSTWVLKTAPFSYVTDLQSLRKYSSSTLARSLLSPILSRPRGR